MPLITYDQVRPWAAAVKRAVVLRIMPPWPADAPRGQFTNDWRLGEGEISIIRRWADSGALAGDPREGAPERAFPEGWQLGRPDLVLHLPRPQQISGNNKEIWKYFWFDQVFDQDTWIRAVEIHPGNYKLVHHANLQVITPVGNTAEDWSRVPDEFDAPQNEPPEIPGTQTVQLHVGLPGQFSTQTAPGTAMLIPAHSRLRINIHYAPSKTLGIDDTEVGLYFASGRIDKQWRLLYGGPPESAIRIPAGAGEHEIQSTTKLEAPMTALQIGCHMHIRGRSYRVDATLPDGQIINLLYVPRYNFHWQFLYILARPIHFPAGTILHDVATFDNSARNALVTEYDTANREVRFGNRTIDEMMASYILATADNERLGLIIDGRTGTVVGRH
jgi:hypothetical protein